MRELRLGRCSSLALAAIVRRTASSRRRLQDGRHGRQGQLAEGRGAAAARDPAALQGRRVREQVRRLAGRRSSTTRPTSRRRPTRTKASSRRAPRAPSSTRPPGKQPPYVIGFPFPTIDDEGSRRGGQDPLEPLLPHLVLRQHPRRVADQLDQPDGASSDAPTSRRASATTTASRRTSCRRRTRTTSCTATSRWSIGPADLNGTARAHAGATAIPAKRDSTWAYVPALRRVRATSPANRSDGFLGSDESQDDGQFFDGKVEDFDVEARRTDGSAAHRRKRRT